jgi:phage replication-related protein YjqB (UPF0714/DUF867 family)
VIKGNEPLWEAPLLDHASAPCTCGCIWSVRRNFRVSKEDYRRQIRNLIMLLEGAGFRDRVLAAELARRLRIALPGYRVVDDLDRIPRRLRGLDPRNPVNRASRGGVQVELPHPVRAIGPYGYGERGDVHRTHTEALVTALAEFATDIAGQNS